MSGLKYIYATTFTCNVISMCRMSTVVVIDKETDPDRKRFMCYICLYGLFVYLRIMHELYAFICIIFHYFCKLFRSNEAELLVDGLALR